MKNMFDLNGKTALVTGGTRGLGRGMAEGLAEAGAKVVIVGSSAGVLKTAEELRAKGLDVAGIRADLGQRDKIPAMFQEALKMLGGKIDILLNDAGVQRRNHCEDFTLEDWDTVINVNLNAVFVLCQLAGREMLKQGSGKIINMASMLSFFGGFTVPAYAASKGAVAQLTKALSNEWAGKNIQVNAIAPGYMATEMNTALINDNGRNTEILARIPAGRWGTPEDMKGLAVFLASDASNYVSGAVIPLDGGYLAK
ncbi:MAG: SDR family oxidoreductase [Clostridiales bacterium]|jgi:2-deoxy-D-gluconate 3-dehydrogenase|nr:SDR family oxidoreductase [Clostridiales bacterium]MCI2161672.1 SDR family oxidoreductase [Oscillospiraceae bacterium]CAB1243300.1 2-keto-3-deoxygluconate oxidoreductase [Ruminococcaceae bacterium BL-4]MCI1961435.1 SDR family oxidoreductase [Clostridiales bacterium]MCI2022156.1 SDR family oxidoreductase [Clostridiales bacterium]